MASEMRPLLLYVTLLLGFTPSYSHGDELVPPPARPDPKFDKAQEEFTRGVALLDEGEAEAAAEAFARAVTQRPDDVEFRCAHAAAMLQARKPGAAWHTLDPVSQENEGHPAIEQQRIAIWQALGSAGTFNVGAPADRVVELLGPPDRREPHESLEHWHYQFMTVYVQNGKVQSVIDGRGYRPALVESGDAFVASFVAALDESDWRIGHRMSNRGQLTVDFVRDDETVQTWQELVSVEQLFELSLEGITPDRLMQEMRAPYADREPPVKWQVLRSMEDRVIFQWSVPGLPENQPQEEIVAIVSGPRDILRVTYRRRGSEIGARDVANWMNRFGKLGPRTRRDLASSPVAENRYRIWYLGRQLGLIVVLTRQNAPNDIIEALWEQVQAAGDELGAALPELPEQEPADEKSPAGQHRALLEWAIRRAGPAMAQAIERESSERNGKLFQAAMNCHLLTEVYQPDSSNVDAIRGVIQRSAAASGLDASLWMPVVDALEQQASVPEVDLLVRQLHERAVRQLEMER